VGYKSVNDDSQSTVTSVTKKSKQLCQLLNITYSRKARVPVNPVNLLYLLMHSHVPNRVTSEIRCMSVCPHFKTKLA